MTTLLKAAFAVDPDLSHRHGLAATGQKAVEFEVTRGANFAKAYPCACPCNYSYHREVKHEQKCSQDQGLSEPLQSLDGALQSSCCFALEVRTLQLTVTNIAFDMHKKKSTTWFVQLVQL